MGQHRIFRYIFVYTANRKSILFVGREYFTDRIFICKSFTGKTLRNKNASGNNQILQIPFQQGDTENLKKATIHIDIIHIRQQLLFIINIILSLRKNTTCILHLLRHTFGYRVSCRCKDRIIIVGTIIAHYLPCAKIGYLGTYHCQPFCLRVTILITQFKNDL